MQIKVIVIADFKKALILTILLLSKMNYLILLHYSTHGKRSQVPRSRSGCLSLHLYSRFFLQKSSAFFKKNKKYFSRRFCCVILS